MVGQGSVVQEWRSVNGGRNGRKVMCESRKW